MNNTTKDLLTKCIWTSLIIFGICSLFCKYKTIYDFIGIVGEVITLTLFIMGFYCTVLWKYNPLEKTPRLMGTYNGIIEYNFNNIKDKKDVSVIIKQTLLSIKVQIITNEIMSNSITGNIVEENDEYVLYYSYRTNPKSKYSKDNPVQYGTCRIPINDREHLNGTYWTSRQTIGDIELFKMDVE